MTIDSTNKSYYVSYSPIYYFTLLIVNQKYIANLLELIRCDHVFKLHANKQYY